MATTISIPGGAKVALTVYGDGTVIAGNGNDTIDVTGRGKVIVAGGNDSVTLGHGGLFQEHGASGHDTITLGLGNDTIIEQGHATVLGAKGSYFGSATIQGGELTIKTTRSLVNKQVHFTVTEHAQGGHTTLIGSSAATEFIAGKGMTSMVGGSGADTFVGGSGSDTMVGGKGSGLFEFLAKDAGGQHLIKDFVSGKDHLYIEGHSLSYLQKHGDISTHGGNTYIHIDGGKTTIELQGVTKLTDSDITTHKG